MDRLIDRMIALKVGGSYWESQPELPDRPYVLVHVRDRQTRAEKITQVRSDLALLSTESIAGPFDPWHLVNGAAKAIVDADSDVALIAALAGVSLRPVGEGPFADLNGCDRSALRTALCPFAKQRFLSPFGGDVLSFAEALELCGFWRTLIDSNRGRTAAVGFAFWKRKTVAPLLWGGTSAVPFVSGHQTWKPTDRVAVWKSRTRRHTLERLERSGAEIVETEDGFIRSAGLGADCVPPLSIVVDSRGIYFDPKRPSDLEQLLQESRIAPKMLLRAKQLRELIVQLGVSKYGAGGPQLERRGPKRHLLVVGQVEDDRAVVAGLGPTTNFELLRKVREGATEAYIIYKPHPDVEAGHRTGAIADDKCLQLADEVVRDMPISSLINLVDEVHVNTSLAGFEALLRGKSVTTYGVPFYAGWGLTQDLGPMPARRTAKRNIDELVAATLLLYPRYLDPITGLPCPPETLVRRIAVGGVSSQSTRLVRLRRLQGKWKRSLALFRFGRK